MKKGIFLTRCLFLIISPIKLTSFHLLNRQHKLSIFIILYLNNAKNANKTHLHFR